MARCAWRALGSGHGFKCLYVPESSQQPTGWELWLSHFAHEGAGTQGGDSHAPGHAALLAFLDHPSLSTIPPQPPFWGPALCEALLIFPFSVQG